MLSWRFCFVVFVAVALSGCLIPDGSGGYMESPGTAGAIAGASEFVQAVPGVLDSAAGGGIVVGTVAAAMALWKSIRKGLQVAKQKRVEEVAEGVVKAANGDGPASVVRKVKKGK